VESDALGEGAGGSHHCTVDLVWFVYFYVYIEISVLFSVV
jgi:hypothetical protein